MNCKKNAKSRSDDEHRLFDPAVEKVVELGLERLRPFENNPFKVKEDEAMARLMESIERYGIMNPLIVMPTTEGFYRIISGHRRKYCAEKLGYTQVPVIIRYMKEDDSIIYQSKIKSNHIASADAVEKRWKSNQDTRPYNENIEKEYQKLLETLFPEQEEVLTKYCDEIFASGAETEEFFYRLGIKDGLYFFGWEMALGNLIVGCIWCITIVGILFGKHFFKMARLSFMPFGASVIG